MNKRQLTKRLSTIFLFTVLLLSSCEETSRNESSLPSVSNDISDVGHHFMDTAVGQNSVAWGLGKNVTAYVTNDRDYEWYVDQYNTGEHWAENCGPSSVEMAGRYYNPDFNFTAEEARHNHHPDGGWWYDQNIRGSMLQFGIEYGSITIHNTRILTNALDAGNIVLVNPTMERVAMEKRSTHRTGLYYTPGTGHYIIVKGYVIVDEVMFFEIYDPWSIDMRYSDGTLKGIDRYYDAISLMDALHNWFRVGYTIPKMASV